MDEDKEQSKEEFQEEQKAQAEHKMRMRFGWDDLIEEMIQEGQEKGAFDNLSGEGKPLELERNSYNAEWDLAHAIMKDNDVTPAWIAHRNKTTAAVSAFRADLQRSWPRYQQAYQLAQGASQRSALILEWDDRCRAWALDIVRINKQISDFNLRRPGGNDNLELFKMNLADELRKIGASRRLS